MRDATGTEATTGFSFGQTAIVVLVIYLLLLIALGIAGWLKSRATEEDFYLAGRGQGFLVTVMTIMATFFSSAAILGIPGGVYKDGVAFMLFAMNLPCAGAAIYLLGSKIRRIGQRRGYVTQGDMIAEYYGHSPSLRIAVAAIGFLYVLPYIIIQLAAGGHLAEAMFPDQKDNDVFTAGAAALSVVTMIYVLIGGMRSVAWTDVVQGFLLLTGMLVASAATIVSLGGFGGFFEKVSEIPGEALSLPGPNGKWTPWMLMTVCMFASVASLIQPAQWIRLYAARNDRTLKRSALTFSVVLPSCFLFGIMLVALAGRAVYPPELNNGELAAHPAVGDFDQIVIVMIKEQLPALMGGFGVIMVSVIMVAVLAASMSTADSNLHALSAVVTRDVYSKLLRPRSSQRERAWVGRIVIVAATLLALWMVREGHDSEEFKPLRMIRDMMFAAIAFACQLLPVTLDMLFLRKGTRTGALAGMIAGAAIVFLSTPFVSGAVRDALHLTGYLDTFDLGFCGFAVNCVVFVLVSLFTRRLPAAHVAAFAKDMEPDEADS